MIRMIARQRGDSASEGCAGAAGSVGGAARALAGRGGLRHAGRRLQAHARRTSRQGELPRDSLALKSIYLPDTLW